MFFSHFRLIDRSNVVSNCIILFHDYCLVLITTIFSYVIFIFFICYKNRNHTVKSLQRSNFLEIVWTIIPIFFLLSLRLPSFLIIYYLEGESKNDLTFKRIRHQWYWSYENSDFYDVSFDSYITPERDLAIGENRLLEVDNSLVLPFRVKIRIIITSTDVLHAWALPSICLKVDAVPRRLNTLLLHSSFPRSFFRQCSEICRINHSFIPIHVEFVTWQIFLKNLLAS